MKPTKRQLDLLMWFARQPTGRSPYWDRPVGFSGQTIHRCMEAGWLAERKRLYRVEYRLTDEGRRVV